MKNEKFTNELEVREYLKDITGHNYTVAVASVRKWGSESAEVESRPEGYYQIMPQRMDDGFFNWYSFKRQWYQFFESHETAVIHFVKYWHKWKEEQTKHKNF